MKAFAFSLQRVLDVKVARESRFHQALAAAQGEAAAIKRTILELQAELREQLARLESLRGAPGRADRLRAQLGYLDAVQERIGERSEALLKQEQKVARAREQLEAAVRERKSLDRLRDRERLDWAAEVRRMEQKQNDEAASALFLRLCGEEPAPTAEPGGYGR